MQATEQQKKAIMLLKLNQMIDQQKKDIMLLKLNQMTLKELTDYSTSGDKNPEKVAVFTEYIKSINFKRKFGDSVIEAKPEQYNAIVKKFIGLCLSSACHNRKLTDIMKTGVISLNETRITLPNINPFEYIELKELQSLVLAPKNNWAMITEDRLAKLVNIANFLDGNTVDNLSSEMSIINGINMCIFYYKQHTRIAYLLYACALSSMLLWADFYYFPLEIPWEGNTRETLNYSIPLKSLQKWSFLNIVLKSIASPVTIDNIGTAYAASSYDLYTMSYYSPALLTSNCLMSSLLEATYLQDYYKLKSSKIFIAMQAHMGMPDIQYKSTRTLGDIGMYTTHWGSSYQDSEGLMKDLRVRAESTGYVCVKDRIPYKDNEIYIAKSTLYSMVWAYKNTLRNNHLRFHTLNLLDEYNFLMSRVSYLFYKLRIILEIIYASKEEKIPRAKILADYQEDLARENVIATSIRYSA